MNRDTGSRVETVIRDPRAIRTLMKHKGVSGAEMSAVCGFSQATMSRLLNGKVNRIDNGAAKRLARRLDQPYELLFDERLFFVSRDYAHRNVVPTSRKAA